MSANKTIESIIQSGGWCELTSASGRGVRDRFPGRIVVSGNGFLVIENLNKNGDFWDGFLLLRGHTFQFVKKAFWINKYLSVGGTVINPPSLPDFLKEDTYDEMVKRLIEKVEPVKVQFDSGEVTGYIKSFNGKELVLKILNHKQIDELIHIPIESMKFIQVLSKSIHEADRKYKRIQTQGEANRSAKLL